MEMRHEMIQRPSMLVTFRQHVVEASTGAEFFSIATLFGLAVAQLLDVSNRNSILFRLFAQHYPGVWSVTLLAVALVHLACFFRPSIVPFIATRKVCAVCGFAVWIGLLYDLYARASYGGVILVVPCVALLFVAIARMRYTV